VSAAARCTPPSGPATSEPGDWNVARGRPALPLTSGANGTNLERLIAGKEVRREEPDCSNIGNCLGDDAVCMHGHQWWSHRRLGWSGHCSWWGGNRNRRRCNDRWRCDWNHDNEHGRFWPRSGSDGCLRRRTRIPLPLRGKHRRLLRRTSRGRSCCRLQGHLQFGAVLPRRLHANYRGTNGTPWSELRRH
jgi:hypothetical protein